MMKLNDRKRPPMPSNLDALPGGDSPITGELLDLMQRCWSQDPPSRPGFEEIVNILRGLHVSLTLDLGLWGWGSGVLGGWCPKAPGRAGCRLHMAGSRVSGRSARTA